MPIDPESRRRARTRAGNQCEYCHCHQDQFPFVTFHVEHVIIARQHYGSDDESNLCLSCHWCNYHKGPNIATQVEGQLVPLFNPRTQNWDDNFVIEGDRIVGRTSIGVGTARLLNMNDEDRRELRRAASS